MDLLLPFCGGILSVPCRGNWAGEGVRRGGGLGPPDQFCPLSRSNLPLGLPSHHPLHASPMPRTASVLLSPSSCARPLSLAQTHPAWLQCCRTCAPPCASSASFQVAGSMLCGAFATLQSNNEAASGWPFPCLALPWLDRVELPTHIQEDSAESRITGKGLRSSHERKSWRDRGSAFGAGKVIKEGKFVCLLDL